MSPEDASKALQGILDACIIISPNSKTHYVAFELIKQNKIAGNHIFGAYLAATAISNSIATTATDNVKDFKKFGVQIINPFAENLQ